MSVANKHVKGKMKKLRERDGDDCWLCHKPLNFALPFDDRMRASLDHVVPRKCGGKNGIENLKIAHQACNSGREALFPDTLIFTEQDILLLTNPNTDTGGLSRAAMKALKAMKRRQQEHVGGELVT